MCASPSGSRNEINVAECAGATLFEFIHFPIFYFYERLLYIFHQTSCADKRKIYVGLALARNAEESVSPRTAGGFTTLDLLFIFTRVCYVPTCQRNACHAYCHSHDAINAFYAYEDIDPNDQRLLRVKLTRQLQLAQLQ